MSSAKVYFESQAVWDESHIQPTSEQSYDDLVEDFADPAALARFAEQHADDIREYRVTPQQAFAWWRDAYLAASRARVRQNPHSSSKLQEYLELVSLAEKWANPSYPFTLRHSKLKEYLRDVPKDADRDFWLGEIFDHILKNAERDGLTPSEWTKLNEVIDEAVQGNISGRQRLGTRPARRRRNPSASPETRQAAIAKYEQFHRYPPKKITEFPKGFAIPTEMVPVGKAKYTTYRSGKVDPATLEKPRRPVDYIHEHDAGVTCYLPVDDEDLDELDVAAVPVTVPAAFSGADALVKLGDNLGFSFQCDGDDEPWEVESVKPLPELYCTVDGKCLLVIQGQREVLAMIWGGALGVFARGIDG